MLKVRKHIIGVRNVAQYFPSFMPFFNESTLSFSGDIASPFSQNEFGYRNILTSAGVTLYVGSRDSTEAEREKAVQVSKNSRRKNMISHAWMIHGIHSRAFTALDLKRQKDLLKPNEPVVFSLIGPINLGTQFFVFIPWSLLQQKSTEIPSLQDVVLGNELARFLEILELSFPDFQPPLNLWQALQQRFHEGELPISSD